MRQSEPVKNLEQMIINLCRRVKGFDARRIKDVSPQRRKYCAGRLAELVEDYGKLAALMENT
jgi:hypothetical protein